MGVLLSALLFCVHVHAQDLIVKGHVADPTGEPIIGANIIVIGTTTGTITDYDGNFTLKVADKKAVLRIGYIGYKEVELPVSANLLQIVLKEDTELLDEVVIIGYGTVKKSDATGSVTAIKPDEFNKGMQTTAQDALVGKMSGVNVVAGSGAPGSSATIRIRSGASLSASNDPLIVID